MAQESTPTDSSVDRWRPHLVAIAQNLTAAAIFAVMVARPEHVAAVLTEVWYLQYQGQVGPTLVVAGLVWAVARKRA